MVELLDLYPTLVDVCGPEGRPGNLQGRSLKPLLANAAAPWDKPAISPVPRGNGEKMVMGQSLRTERYRYSEWGPAGKLGMSDTTTRPNPAKCATSEPIQKPQH